MMRILHRILNSPKWRSPNTFPKLTNEQRYRLEAIWPKIEAYNTRLTRREVAAGVSLIGRVKPGRHCKHDVARLTKGILQRPTVVTKKGDIYFLLKKSGETLGEGQSKRVYEGVWVHRDQAKLFADLTVRCEIEAAKNECRLAKKIGSPFVMRKILAIYDYVGQTRAPEGEKRVKQDKLFIAQKKMDGDLEDLAFDTDFSIGNRFSAVIQIAKGVRDMHQKRISHNDLHSGNVLFSRRNGKLQFKITDLGCAEHDDHLKGGPDDVFRLGRIIGNMFLSNHIVTKLLSKEMEGRIRDLVRETGEEDPNVPQPTAQEVLDTLKELSKQVAS